jgi:hypothetical protein
MFLAGAMPSASRYSASGDSYLAKVPLIHRPQWMLDDLADALGQLQADFGERDLEVGRMHAGPISLIRPVAALRHCDGAYSQQIGYRSQDMIAASV